MNVTAGDRKRLAAIVANRNSPQKHVWRARIVLLTADGFGTAAVMRQTGKSKSVVWRWQERFMQARVDGLLRDKTRPSRKPPLAREVISQVIDLTAAAPSRSGRADPLDGAGHGQDGRDQRQLGATYLARARPQTAPGVWSSSCPMTRPLPPSSRRHRRALRRSADHAVVLSVGEKSQIQALRSHPTRPADEEDSAGTMTHDYKARTAPLLCSPAPQRPGR